MAIKISSNAIPVGKLHNKLLNELNRLQNIEKEKEKPKQNQKEKPEQNQKDKPEQNQKDKPEQKEIPGIWIGKKE